jgi:hypothetical protein
MSESETSTIAADPAELDKLYAAWRRLGVGFTVTASQDTVEVERLILATAAKASADERLMARRLPQVCRRAASQ